MHTASVSRLSLIVMITMFAMLFSAAWMPSAAQTPVTGEETAPTPDVERRLIGPGSDESGSEPDTEDPPDSSAPPPMGVMATDFVTTLQITLTESSGSEFLFPAGQEICLQATVTPPAPEAPLILRPCFNGFDGIDRLWGGLPDLSVTEYAVAVVSNTTTCTVTVPTMETFGAGTSAPYAIFHVKATCPDAPPAPTEPPLAPTYGGLQINYVNDGAPADLAGIICTSIVVDPVVPRSPMNSCTMTSTFMVFWIGTLTTPLPESAIYTATVTRNESGCTASVQPLRVVERDGGRFAEIDVLINCDPVPEPTYVGIAIEIVDSSGTDRSYPGALCANMLITPAIPTIAGGACAAATGSLGDWPAGAVVLPRTSAYSAAIVSNDTGCTVASSFREEALGPDLMAVVVLTTTCEDPAAVSILETLTVMVNDRSGAPITTYPGDLCINVLADPVLTFGHPHGPTCGSVTPRTATWSSVGTIMYPADTSYTAVVASNATGCEVEIDPAVVVPVPDGMFAATIQVWLRCDEVPVDPEPTATPTPAVEPTVTPIPTELIPTVTATEPRPTVDPTLIPEETPAATETLVAARAGETPGGDKTRDASTNSATPLVTGLPSTGIGEPDDGPTVAFAVAISAVAGLIMAGALLVIRRTASNGE